MERDKLDRTWLEGYMVGNQVRNERKVVISEH